MFNITLNKTNIFYYYYQKDSKSNNLKVNHL